MDEALFEVSSEAGRKVGGIYTVLQSKAPYMKKRYGENYILIGFLDEKAGPDFAEEQAGGRIKEAILRLGKEGIEVKYGRWVKGAGARIFLVDAKKYGGQSVTYDDGGPKSASRGDYVKFLLWKNFQVDSLMEKSWDFSENIVWGWGVGRLLEELLESGEFSEGKSIGHFHEWISGAALLYCRMKKLPLKTVFTTHATVLGRTLASSGRDVLSEAHSGRGRISVSEAYQFKVEGKHQVEAASAHAADVFTTVSETVGDEVKYILGRKPDVITLNGMDFEGEKAEAEVFSLCRYVRRELLQFVESLFIPYYPQNYRDPLFVYISGRYEYRNKGFDVFIGGLGELNRRLKEKKTSRRVFAFIFAPSAVSGPRIPAIKNYLLLDKIHEILEESSPGFRDAGYENLETALKKKEISPALKHKLEGMASGFVRDSGKPLINCYDLNYSNDQIVHACHSAGLTNAKDDVVKAVFYPTYLKANDGLLNLDYYDVISGMDVGVFPSRYEPFGYTPVEAGLKLNVAITSDSTGFGKYISGKVSLKGRGVHVLSMDGKPEGSSALELADELEGVYRMDSDSLTKLKRDSYSLVRLCDWKELVGNYFKAYEMALGSR